MSELRWDDFLSICKSKKPNQFKPPDWDAVYSEIAQRLGVCYDAVFNESLLPLREKYHRVMKGKQTKTSSDRSDANVVVLESKNFNQSPPTDQQPKKRKTKSLDQLGLKQLHRRTDPLWEKIQEFATDNEETPLRILAALLSRCGDRHAKEFGEQVWNECATETHISVISAMAILVDCALGRETYGKLRKVLKKEGHNILPVWSNVRVEQTKISPEPQELPNPHIGIYLPFTKSMQLTAERIMQGTIADQLPSSVVMEIKYGCDGSGSHAIYRQINNAQTSNIILTMFCPLKLKTDGGVVLWEQKTPNSPLTHRPLMLQMGKESTESLQSLAIFNEEQNQLKTEGCTIAVSDVQIPLKVNVASTMMDMKAAHLYLGLGGAYCDLCDTSRQLARDPNRVEQGFEINRTIEDLHRLFEDLVQDDGSVYKRPRDYDQRAGLVSKPIPTNETKSVQVLHALLRSFDHFMKVAVHLRAAVFDWSESPTSINQQFLKNAKSDIQSYIEVVIGEKWDVPDGTGKGGTTTTGNTARKILHHRHNRDVVVKLMPEQYQSIMSQFGQHLSVILRLFCSSEAINVKEYRKLCTNLYLFLLRSFPHISQKPGTWISITPSVHKLLGHSWELIILNEGCGLKNLDESGLEGNNKILRSIRQNLARKTSQTANLVDTINRMWLGSDPQVNEVRLQTQPFCKHCNEHGHSSRYCKINSPMFGPVSSDDALFDSCLLLQ